MQSRRLPFPIPRLAPYSSRCRNPPTNRKSRAIMRARRAPRRRGPRRRQRNRRSTGCSIRASSAAPRDWFGNRPAAAAGQFVRAALRHSQRTSGPQVDSGRARRFRRTPPVGLHAARPRDVACARHQCRIAQGARLRRRSVETDGQRRSTEQSASAPFDEISDIAEPRREKRQMHRPTPQPITLGVTASMQSLDRLLREGRAEFNSRKSGPRTVRRARRNPKAVNHSRSSPTSSRRAISRQRSRIWSRA